jgi:hypothetical protein
LKGKINGLGMSEKWNSRFVRENAKAKHRLKLPVAPESGHNST